MQLSQGSFLQETENNAPVNKKIMMNLSSDFTVENLKSEFPYQSHLTANFKGNYLTSY